MNTDMVEIIIITATGEDFEKDCIKSVQENTNYPHTLTVFHNKDGCGLSKIWNRIISKSTAKYVCILNSDTIVNDGWLDKLVECAEATGGIVGPVSNNAGRRQTMDIGEGYVETDMLSGFCMLFPRSAWNVVGGFDEGFMFYFEDDDFSLRLRNAGYKLYINKEVFVYHIQRATAKSISNIDDIFNKSKEYFENKHNIIWRP